MKLTVLVAVLLALTQQTPPVFRANVDLVYLDVSVLDADRRPVRGLTAADFTILEDGKPQPVAAFSAVEVPTAPPVSAGWMREVASDVRSNTEAQTPDSRLFVILLDDAMIPFDPFAIKSAKQIAREVIDRLGPNDLAAVVLSAGSGAAQNFTHDRAKLLAAVEKFNANYASYKFGWDTAHDDPRRPNSPQLPTGDSDAFFRLGSFSTLQLVVESLAAAPQRRKALVYVSPGVTVELPGVNRPTVIAPDAREANRRILRDMPELMRSLQRANVTVYAIDPCGFQGLEQYVAQATRGLPGLRQQGNPSDTTRPMNAEDLGHSAARLDTDFLLTAANNTHGFAVINTNDFGPGVERIFTENDAYYIVGYRVPAANKPNSMHRINVKVNRPKVEVRTRTGYTTPKAPSKTTAGPMADLGSAIGGPLPLSDWPMQAAVAPFAGAAPGETGVIVALGLRRPSAESDSTSPIDMEAVSYTPDGRTKGTPQRMSFPNTRPTGAPNTLMEVLTFLTLAPGRYELRLAAARRGDTHGGSVYADVEVPDFAKAPLSMSGLVFEVVPAAPAARNSIVASIVPVSPTTVREFSPTDRVTLFLRIYEGGDAPLAPAKIVVQLKDAHDAIVVDQSGTVELARFNARTRSADLRVTLPIDRLAAGDYLLRAEASLATRTIERATRFKIN